MSWCGYDMWEVLGEVAIGEEGSVPTHCHHQHKGGGGDCLQEGQWVTNWEEVFFRNVLEIFPGYLNLSEEINGCFPVYHLFGRRQIIHWKKAFCALPRESEIFLIPR